MPHCKSLSDKNSWLYKHQMIFWPFVKHSEEPRRTKTPTFYLKSLQSWWRCTQYRYYSVLIPSMSKGLDKGRHHITDIFRQGRSLQKNFQGFLIALQSDHGHLKTSIPDFKCLKNPTKVDTYISDHFIWTALQKPPCSWYSTSSPCPWDQPSATICTNICHWSFCENSNLPVITTVASYRVTGSMCSLKQRITSLLPAMNYRLGRVGEGSRTKLLPSSSSYPEAYYHM